MIKLNIEASPAFALSIALACCMAGCETSSNGGSAQTACGKMVARNDFNVSGKWIAPKLASKDFWLLDDPLMEDHPQYRNSPVKEEPILTEAGIITTAGWKGIICEQDASKFPVLAIKEVQVYEAGNGCDISKQAKAAVEGAMPAAADGSPGHINDGNVNSECRANRAFILTFPRAHKINRLTIRHGGTAEEFDTELEFRYKNIGDKTWRVLLGVQVKDLHGSVAEFSFPEVEACAMRLQVKGAQVPRTSSLKQLDRFLEASKANFREKPLIVWAPGWRGGGGRADLPYANIRIDQNELSKLCDKYQFTFLRFFSGEWDNDFYICSDWDGNWSTASRYYNFNFRKKNYISATVPKPESREEALHFAEDYYRKRDTVHYGRLLDFSEMSPWNHYTLEWGERETAIETTGQGAPSHQVQVAFARGAARQYQTSWGWYLAYFWNGSHPLSTQLGRNEPDYIPFTAFPYGGISLSLAQRDMYLAYLNGATFLTNEDWPQAFFQPSVAGDYGSPWKLSPHGEALKEWFAFTQRNPDRGVSYTPVALLMDYHHGWSASFANLHTWLHFPLRQQDHMITSFMYTLFPWKVDRADDDSRLSNSPYGDIYDVLIANPPSGKLDIEAYKVTILLGDVKMDMPLADKLMNYVEKGGTLVVNAKQIAPELSQTFLGASLSGGSAPCGKMVISTADGEKTHLSGSYDCVTLKLNGAIPILVDDADLPVMTVNNYGKGKVVLTTPDWMVEKGLADYRMKSPLIEFLLKRIIPETIPIKVDGDIEYGMNKLPDGWLVYLINNKGVHKKPTEAATFDMKETSTVRLWQEKTPKAVDELRTDGHLSYEADGAGVSFKVEIPPGDIRILKITE